MANQGAPLMESSMALDWARLGKTQYLQDLCNGLGIPPIDCAGMLDWVEFGSSGTHVALAWLSTNYGTRKLP